MSEWTADGNDVIRDADGVDVCIVLNRILARRIILAVNAHDALVAACEAARRHGTLAETEGWAEMIRDIDAALAKAKEGAE